MSDFDEWFKLKYPNFYDNYVNKDNIASVIHVISQDSWNYQQKKVNFKDKCIENLKLQLENKQIDCDISDKKIDALESKLQSVLNLACKLQHSSGERIYSDIKELLK